MPDTSTLVPSPPAGEDDLFTLILFGHTAFQYLHAGCALGVFELLHQRPGVDAAGIAAHAGLAPRPVRCLLLGLVSLGLARREGEGYRNGPAIEGWFARGEWRFVDDMARFQAQIVYPGEQDFVESLRADSNVGLRRIPGQAPDLYRRMAETPELQQTFYRLMGSWSRISIPLLLESFDFSAVRHAVDVGGGDATNAIALASAYPEMRVTLLDLPENCRVAEGRIAGAGLGERIRVAEGDMFRDPFPGGHDCFLFIHQMVIWPLDVITGLLARAHQALEPGGVVVIFNSVSDDDGSGPLMAALDSAYFVSLPISGGGMIYPWSDYEACLRQAGFTEVQCIPCQAWTPHGVIVGRKG